MKILYIYREKEKNEHSIEAVFDTVAAGMEARGHEIHKWYKPVLWKQCLKEIRQLRKEDYDLYHITGDVNYLWILFPWSKTTMTVHDIGFYKNNPFRLVIWLMTVIGFMLPNWFLKGITCVSELTKNDIIKYLHVSGKRLHVVTNPLALPMKRCDRQFNKECPKILQIGTGDHKNLIGLIEAAKGLNCEIDIIGNPDLELRDKMDEYGEKYTISYRIPTEDIVHHYNNCDILYFVSKSEGFGMPIIEAQTVGRVVLTTNTEPTKTVAGGAAMLYATDDYKGIREGLEMVINDDKFRENIISKGYKNAAMYQPDMVVVLYENFYKQVYKIV